MTDKRELPLSGESPAYNSVDITLNQKRDLLAECSGKRVCSYKHSRVSVTFTVIQIDISGDIKYGDTLLSIFVTANLMTGISKQNACQGVYCL